MEEWTGINTFEYNLLSQLKRVTDHKGNVVEDTYDGNRNQTSLTYPDDTTVEYTYDLDRAVHMEYPHGWVEEYEYDSI